MLNFSFSFRFVNKNCGIFIVVVVFVTKINLISSTKIFVFVVVDEKTLIHIPPIVDCWQWHLTQRNVSRATSLISQVHFPF